MTPKEQLSQHVENIFKRYSEPGLHVCDLATGGGKSYTIGKLTCEYYSGIFDRIVILCVQNKLVEGMDREIKRFINEKESKIRPEDTLIIKSNIETFCRAAKDDKLKVLLDQMRNANQCIENETQKKDVQLIKKYKAIKVIYDGLLELINTEKQTDYIKEQINEAEWELRKKVKEYFALIKGFEKGTSISIEKDIPALFEAYPQAGYKEKKVLLMTVQKAIHGIDPILDDTVKLNDLTERNKRTLILFDESDQAAVAIRDAIIDDSTKRLAGDGRYDGSYQGFLMYKSLFGNSDRISSEYHGDSLNQAISKAQKTSDKVWLQNLNGCQPYNNIFLSEEEDLERYRRGVFFCGKTSHMYFSNDKKQSYICHKKGEKHFSLVHCDKDSTPGIQYETKLSLKDFISTSERCRRICISSLAKVAMGSLKKNRDSFNQEKKFPNNNGSARYRVYPTLENEIYTLASRFESKAESTVRQDILDFSTNRKNLSFDANGATGKIKLPDYSIYMQGIRLYMEEPDMKDSQHRIRLSCRKIENTPEKIIYNLVSSGNTSVVLCSATASSMSVVSNFDMEYLSLILGDKFKRLSKDDIETFDRLSLSTYPEKHSVQIIPIEQTYFEAPNINTWKLPEKYEKMFCPEAVEGGLVRKWFNETKSQLERQSSNKSENRSVTDEIQFQLNRILQFVEVYHWFHTHDDIHSMIFFQNRSGIKDKEQFTAISCLIDGSYKEMQDSDDSFSNNCKNPHLRFSKDREEVEEGLLKELGTDRNAKLMLVTAYGSFKAGANLQYNVPDGLQYLKGDNWDGDGKQAQKDWDAMFLQCPSSYLTISEDSDADSYEKNLHQAMLVLSMLKERGNLSYKEVTRWLNSAFSNNFAFSEKLSPGVLPDKSAWTQSVLEQAVGRLCRTRNKPSFTYILYDEKIENYFDGRQNLKSQTKEYGALSEFIINHPSQHDAPASEEVILCNTANEAKSILNRIRSIALTYNTPGGQGDTSYYDEDEEDPQTVSSNVLLHQHMLQQFKSTIIRKPVIGSFDELSIEDRKATFIHKCYGNWIRNERNDIHFYVDNQHPSKDVIPSMSIKGKDKGDLTSPSHVRLDILMKNDIIHRYFVEHGYATTWEKEGLILHPRILANEYAGEIGEEAFKAIVLHFTNCNEDIFKHLEGREYELADFVLNNPDGSHKVAFDVKNMNPKAIYDDNPNDIPTTIKRKYKEERLGCDLYTINILQLQDASIDRKEIGGLIDNEGQFIKENIDRLRRIVDC